METVLVVGAGGYFGGLLVEELLRYCDCRIILGARNLPRLEKLMQSMPAKWQQRLETQQIDLGVQEALAPVISRVQIAICAAGPYHNLPHSLLQECLKQGVHYIDLSDDRAFVRQVYRLCQQDQGKLVQSVVCTGWSTMPALSALLTGIASQHMERIDRIRIQIAPGHQSPRSASTVASILNSIGHPFQIRRENNWVTVTGWSEPEEFQFPSPVGRQIGYLVDVPDHELFPPLFNAASVEFRVGAEIALFNKLCCLLALGSKFGLVDSWAPWSSVIQKAVALTGFLGHDWGAVGVECTGVIGDMTICRQACIVASRNGQYIPVMPAVAMCILLLNGDQRGEGIMQLKGWLSRTELAAHCNQRGYELVVREVGKASD